MEILYLIPARGGSKGIPRKNIASVGGRPLIAWSIAAAKQSRYSGRVVVSTDCEEIAAVARAHGADIPFMRPEALARDDVPSLDSVLHALDWLRINQQYSPEYLMLLQPTSPLRTAADIAAAIELTRARNADAVVSVSPVSCHPYLTKTVDHNGHIADFVPPPQKVSRRQEMPQVFGLNGAIYLIRPKVLIERRTWYPEGTVAYVMPPERAMDIDAPWDLRLANLIVEDNLRQERAAAHGQS